MAAGEVCAEVTKLADRVYEIGLVVERLKADGNMATDTLRAHQSWLTTLQSLMERMAVSEADRKSLHEQQYQDRTDLLARLDAVTITARWAIGLTLPVLATGVFEIIRFAFAH